MQERQLEDHPRAQALAIHRLTQVQREASAGEKGQFFYDETDG